MEIINKNKKIYKVCKYILLLVCIFIASFNLVELSADEGDVFSNGDLQISAEVKYHGVLLTEGTVISSVNQLSNTIVAEYYISGRSEIGQRLEFEVAEPYQYTGTFMNAFQNLQYENEIIATVSYTERNRKMIIEFIAELDFEAMIPANHEIIRNNPIFNDVGDEGADIETFFQISGDYTYRATRVIVRFSPIVRGEPNFVKSLGLFDPYNRNDNSMLYHINVTTNLSNPGSNDTVHYIADMPQDGSRFHESSLEVYERLANGSRGELLFQPSRNINNGQFSVYRLFYDLDGNGHAAMTSERFPLKGYINPTTGEDIVSANTAMVPKNYRIIGMDEEIPLELENQPYGFLIEIKNNTSNAFTVIYETIIYNTEVAEIINGNPRLNNKASYYAQEIPNCFDDDTLVCRPVTSESMDRSSSGEIPSGTIIVNLRFGRVDIRKFGVVKQGEQVLERELLEGAIFTLKTRYGSVVEGRHGSTRIPLHNIISEKELSGGTNLYIYTDEGKIALNDIQIPTGAYILEETHVPEGFESTGDIEILVQVDQTNEYEIENYKYIQLLSTGRVNIKIYEIFLEGDREVERNLLSGAIITLKDSNGQVVIGEYNSQIVLLEGLISRDKEVGGTNVFIIIDGEMIPISDIDIPLGTYHIEEVFVPGYYTLEGNTTITVRDDEIQQHNVYKRITLNPDDGDIDNGDNGAGDIDNGDIGDGDDNSGDKSVNKTKGVEKSNPPVMDTVVNSIPNTADTTNIAGNLLLSSIVVILALCCIKKRKGNEKQKSR